MAIVVIPARGGSKRVKRKNIRQFSGRPIISYSIEVALASKLFDDVYVSTEDAQIAHVASNFGAKIIHRPQELADDFTPTIPVVRHAIDYVEESGLKVDSVCCLYPTAPFLEVSDLTTSFEIFRSGEWQFVISATDYKYPVHRSFRINKSGGIGMLFPSCVGERTQDLETIYHDADKFYWGRKTAWLTSDTVFNDYSTALVMPSIRSYVIDTEEDWRRAEVAYLMRDSQTPGEFE